MKTLVSLTVLSCLAACGGDATRVGDHANSAASSAATSADPVTYQLIGVADPFVDPVGSRIQHRIAHAPPIVEGLQGSLELVQSDLVPGNTIFSYRITKIHLSSHSFAVDAEGDVGGIAASKLNRFSPIFGGLTVAINGLTVELTASGEPGTFTGDRPPDFRGVRLHGAGFNIALWAVPVC